ARVIGGSGRPATPLAASSSSKVWRLPSSSVLAINAADSPSPPCSSSDAPLGRPRSFAGWSEGSFAGALVAGAERRAVGVAPGVGGAEPGEVPPGGRGAGGVVDLAVVEFEVAAAVAALNVAFAAPDDHRGADLGGDVAAEVRDAHEVAALLDDRGE